MKNQILGYMYTSYTENYYRWRTEKTGSGGDERGKWRFPIKPENPILNPTKIHRTG